jgi:hypothetical protein
LGAIAPELNVPPSAVMAWAIVSLLVHVTVEPTDRLIGFGVNPPLTIVAPMLVGVGLIGELPHAVAAASNIATSVIFIGRGILGSFQQE